jgi:hypothetical protein
MNNLAVQIIATSYYGCQSFIVMLLHVNFYWKMNHGPLTLYLTTSVYSKY